MHKITIFENILNISDPHFVSLDAVLNAIKNGRYKDKVDAIRNCKEEYKIRSLKANLPCALFSGEFAKPIEKKYDDGTEYISYRDDKSLVNHSGFVPIDIDDIDDINEAKQELINNPYIYALWTSSSGKGLHGLVRIGDGNKHTQHYKALLEKIPGLDPTARNPSRVLYLSYDPELYINENAKEWSKYEIEDITEIGKNIISITVRYKCTVVVALCIVNNTGKQIHKSIIFILVFTFIIISYFLKFELHSFTFYQRLIQFALFKVV